jgi:hypothetical protein
MFWKYIENRGHTYIPFSKSVHSAKFVFSLGLRFFIYYNYASLIYLNYIKLK